MHSGVFSRMSYIINKNLMPKEVEQITKDPNPIQNYNYYMLFTKSEKGRKFEKIFHQLFEKFKKSKKYKNMLNNFHKGKYCDNCSLPKS